MQFLAYIAVVLVSLAGVLLELDWLTKPKLEAKSPVQVASTVTPVRAAPKVDGPSATLSPVYPTKPDTDKPKEAAADQAAGTAPPVSPAPEFAATQTDAAPQSNAQATAVAAQLSVTPAAVAVAPAVTQSAPAKPAQVATVQPAAMQTPNRCDVAGCSAAYQSFRAADCSYQPMEGPRKVCEKPPQAAQRTAATPRPLKIEAAAARPSKDAELRDVERVVRRMTAGDIDGEPRVGRSRVILVERPDRDW